MCTPVRLVEASKVYEPLVTEGGGAGSVSAVALATLEHCMLPHSELTLAHSITHLPGAPVPSAPPAEFFEPQHGFAVPVALEGHVPYSAPLALNGPDMTDPSLRQAALFLVSDLTSDWSEYLDGMREIHQPVSFIEPFPDHPEATVAIFSDGKHGIMQQSNVSCSMTCAAMLCMDQGKSASYDRIQHSESEHIYAGFDVAINDIENAGLGVIKTPIKDLLNEEGVFQLPLIKEQIDKKGPMMVGIFFEGQQSIGHAIIVDKIFNQDSEERATIRDPGNGMCCTIQASTLLKLLQRPIDIGTEMFSRELAIEGDFVQVFDPSKIIDEEPSKKQLEATASKTSRLVMATLDSDEEDPVNPIMGQSGTTLFEPCSDPT